MVKPIDIAPPSVLTNVGPLGGELSRRALLKGGATGAAALSLSALWAGHAHATIGGPGGLKPRSDLLMLVNRLSQGFKASELATATSMGYACYLNHVLDGPTSDPAGDAFVAGMQQTTWPLLPSDVISWTPAQCFSIAPAVDPDGLLGYTQQATIGLSVLSERMLLERMMDFWSNRLNVYGKKVLNGPLKLYGDYHIFRPNALGSVKAMITAFGHDTSGLFYLDNIESAQPIPNENWAREMLELYSMGLIHPITGQNNYSEGDVQAAAAAFTGWSYQGIPGPNALLFAYKPWMHLSGQKTFQGVGLTQVDATPGEGDQVLDIIVNSDKTRLGMAAKMVRFLLHHDSQSNLAHQQIQAAALQYDAGVKAMVSNILSQANVSLLTPADYFLSSPSRFVYQACRAVGASLDSAQPELLYELRRMGNAPFEWAAPNGYPDEPQKWAGGVFARWEFANKLTALDAGGNNPELPGVEVTDSQVLALAQPYSTPMDIINNLDNRLTGGVLSDNEKSVLEAYIFYAASPPYSLTQIPLLRELIALFISCPTFQYY